MECARRTNDEQHVERARSDGKTWTQEDSLTHHVMTQRGLQEHQNLLEKMGWTLQRTCTNTRAPGDPHDKTGTPPALSGGR